MYPQPLDTNFGTIWRQWSPRAAERKEDAMPLLSHSDHSTESPEPGSSPGFVDGPLLPHTRFGGRWRASWLVDGWAGLAGRELLAGGGTLPPECGARVSDAPDARACFKKRGGLENVSPRARSVSDD
ncbi:hypothetical protein M8J77_021924 [Diaphorina citri]|nr:hypothetical protein M8J77_004467 [Diaphorina citri]KAI5695472.1 hypothetical protein M8J77_026285 [Diaphorina citri]KAI5695537.1 hypothetical protein M8J77_023441 [Diaphorina citri]KAI5697958.1 hypothetical protein M8J77_009721 [Diaphorina citri]KAI5699169.1 hypothetical protein M8J77_023826 [Diaphorina citri]